MLQTLAVFRQMPRLVRLLPLVVLAGCANLTPTRTGFLNNYDSFGRVTKHEDMTFRAPTLKANQYTSFVIEPVRFVPSLGGAQGLDAETRDALMAALRDQLTTAFSATYRQVQAPGPGVFKIRAAITAVERSNPVANAVTMALILVPFTSGGASSEMEIVDSESGSRLVARIGANNGGQSFLGGPVGFLSQYGHARRALARQSEALYDLMIGKP